MFKVGWWTTGRDEAAVVLFDKAIEAINKGEIDAKMLYLFLSKDIHENIHCKALKDIADANNIVTVSLPSKDFDPELKKKDTQKWRDMYHDKILEKLEPFKADLVVLAGYMWIASKKACERLDMINLHPALPNGPTGAWQDVIWELIEKRAKTTGVMMHLATPELDRGPAVAYCEFEIQGEKWTPLWDEAIKILESQGINGLKKEPGESLPLFQKIREEGIKREIPLILNTLRAFSKSEIILKDKKLLDKKGSFLNAPYNLSHKIMSFI